MITQLLKSWFGDFNKEELKKFLLLGIIFAFTIGINWLLRTLKDSAFITTTGTEFIPHAKWLSFFISIPLVTIYGKLVDVLPRHRLFYALSAVYGAIALIFAYFLSHQSYGVCNVEADPCRFIGWAWYVFAESFGSIMVTLFWAFVSDTTTPESAKRGYGIIAICGQIGNILGPLLVQKQAEVLGTGMLAGISAGLILLLIPLIHYFLRTIDKKELEGFHGKNEKYMEKKEAQVDFAEGLGILLKRPYLFGIFGIVCFYEIVYAIFDYRFKAYAGILYKGEALTKFFGEFGVITGVIALVSLLLGVSNLPRWLGLTASLVLSPIIMGILTFINLSSSMTAIMWVMVFANALNFALHQPSKEQLYIPTTHEAKYKTKAWIEIFGFRGSKAMGSGVNLATSMLGSYFILFSTVMSLGLVGLWFFTAFALGRTHSKAVAQNKVVC